MAPKTYKFIWLGDTHGPTPYKLTWLVPMPSYRRQHSMFFNTLCYTIVLPGRKSVFRAGFRTDSSGERLKIGPPAGRRPDF